MNTRGIVDFALGKLEASRRAPYAGNCVFRAVMKSSMGFRSWLIRISCAALVLLSIMAGAYAETTIYQEQLHRDQLNGPLPAIQDTAKEQPCSSLENDTERSFYLSMDTIGESGEPAMRESEETFVEEKEMIQGIPLVFNEAVDYYIRYFTGTKRKLFQKWLARKERYAPLIERILNECGVPEDLIYLAMIESGFNLRAYSSQRAAGPWQFIPETGRRYGLVVNHWVDERRDIEKSTIAAARYLQALFNQFDCWYLAAAGYNAGENRIDRLIKKHNTNDFWRLRTYNTLPRETREYVPQLIAAAIIAKNPKRYGITVTGNTTSFAFERETVPGGVPLKAIAMAASSSVSSIRALNPEIRRGIIPPCNTYKIRLPAETDIVTFNSLLPSILNKEKRVVNVIRHVIGKRDNLRKIARKYGVTRKDLVLVNYHPLRLKKGRAIYVPRFAAVPKTAAFTRKASVSRGSKSTKGRHADFHAIKKERKKRHRVKRGENLSTIARKYGKSVRVLMRINGLKNSRIRYGMLLRVSHSGVRPASSFVG